MDKPFAEALQERVAGMPVLCDTRIDPSGQIELGRVLKLRDHWVVEAVACAGTYYVMADEIFDWVVKDVPSL